MKCSLLVNTACLVLYEALYLKLCDSINRYNKFQKNTVPTMTKVAWVTLNTTVPLPMQWRIKGGRARECLLLSSNFTNVWGDMIPPRTP